MFLITTLLKHSTLITAHLSENWLGFALEDEEPLDRHPVYREEEKQTAQFCCCRSSQSSSFSFGPTTYLIGNPCDNSPETFEIPLSKLYSSGKISCH